MSLVWRVRAGGLAWRAGLSGALAPASRLLGRGQCGRGAWRDRCGADGFGRVAVGRLGRLGSRGDVASLNGRIVEAAAGGNVIDAVHLLAFVADGGLAAERAGLEVAGNLELELGVKFHDGHGRAGRDYLAAGQGDVFVALDDDGLAVPIYFRAARHGAIVHGGAELGQQHGAGELVRIVECLGEGRIRDARPGLELEAIRQHGGPLQLRTCRALPPGGRDPSNCRAYGSVSA